MTFRSAGLALAALGVFAAGAGAEDVELRWKFQKDKTYRYTLEQGMEMTMNLQNNKVSTKMNQVADMTWSVSKVNDDGSAETVQTIDRMRIKVEGPGGNFEFDSKNKPEDAQAGPFGSLGKMMEGLVGTPMEVTMTSRGEIRSVKVPEKMTEALKTAGPGGQAVAGAFSEKGLKQMFEQSSMVLPEKPVSPGTTWQQKRSVETAGIGNLDIDVTYTDKGPAEGKPNLREIDGAVSMQFRAPENAAVTISVKDQDASAKFFFDAAGGFLSRSELKQKMQMEIAAGGQSMTQDINQTVAMRLKDDGASSK
jgi:hypothetical protein